jgi:hypothetical protein
MNEITVDLSDVPRWEYKRAVGLTEKELNTYGQKGWELVSVLYPNGVLPTFWLKRRLV